MHRSGREKPTIKYHLGCGDEHLDGYINVGIRSTEAADLVADLSHPVLESTDCVFSNAFFEHLYRNERLSHLEAVRRALTREGLACYIGLPDFRAVAELYLRGGPGVVGPRFDLFNAYRYTHGDPETVNPSGWLEQLHKGLLDADEVTALLSDAGFKSYAVFSYVYPGESVAVSLGFCATRISCPDEDLRRRCRAFLAPFEGRFLEVESIRFNHNAPVRRIPPALRRALHRIALAFENFSRR